ncbi:putative Heme oxygenase (biliverdin-producing) [Rosa chinensis]|uniref:Putative Heme oxygenase (Biliverdin-producing) n=1 Tax=Rosa chinensis TaxID=74649 RepID=A0A2P6Q0B9_ROSCH|nr:probable inactive heme oxygenase 2, chloroplastic isoform X1 [Rosa chinensis]PRQ27621.1 putative Heme oxygenase (biliverdin-producing) [Rosa chinensis]
MQFATTSLMDKAVSPSILYTLSPKPSPISTRKLPSLFLCCSDSSTTAVSTSWSPPPIPATTGTAPPVVRRRTRYRKQYPGESKGITEEMRFVAMRLRNRNGKKLDPRSDGDDTQSESDDNAPDDSDASESDGEKETWQPSVEGLLKYLVDSKLVFDTVERIVDDSNDVAYAYFRNTGLERSEALSKDLQWFGEQGNVIPEPSNPGVSYAKYLKQVAETCAPLFLCHFYNIYFSHISGGQVIARQVSERLLEGRELEFYTWEGDVPELMRGVREKLNKLGEHWSRDDKNKCLRETTKSFRSLGQIIRLIILQTK